MPHELVVDGAAAGLIRRGEVDAVIAGCRPRRGERRRRQQGRDLRRSRSPRAAAGIPFVVAGPASSIDAALPDGDRIEIEERDADEVLALRRRHRRRRRARPCRNPAFDVTPAGLVTALVTERGVAAPPTAASIAGLLA